MVQEPGLIHYACIAKGTIVLAEFNSKDAALGKIAEKCLGIAPPFHVTYTHTVRSETYAFLIDEPFVYFGIFDENLEKFQGLAFLKSLRAAFSGVCKAEKSFGSLRSHCYQGDCYPVFRQLLGSGFYHLEALESPIGQRIGPNENLHCGSGRIVGSPKPCGQFSIGRRNVERKEVEEDEGRGMALSHDFSFVVQKNGGLYSGEHQKAKRIWKKQVWVVLSLDLFVCTILFVVWLWVCAGFKCMNS